MRSSPETEALGAFKARFEKGEGIALFEALEYCWTHGVLAPGGALRSVPVPGWVSNGVLLALAMYRDGRARGVDEALGIARKRGRLTKRKQLVTFTGTRTTKEKAAKVLLVQQFYRWPRANRRPRTADAMQAAVAKKIGLGKRTVRAIYDRMSKSGALAMARTEGPDLAERLSRLK